MHLHCHVLSVCCVHMQVVSVSHSLYSTCLSLWWADICRMWDTFVLREASHWDAAQRWEGPTHPRVQHKHTDRHTRAHASKPCVFAHVCMCVCVTCTQVDTLSSWVNLLTWDAVLKLIPTLVTCVTLMLTMEHCPHPLALPAMLAAIPVLFRLVLLAAGVTVAQAQDAGWVMRPTVRHTHTHTHTLHAYK